MKSRMYLKISYCYILFTALVGTLFFSCAQIVNPEGGAKDTQPPIALLYKPDSAAVNFKGNSFSITFNEYVQLKDISGQLVVSPPLKKVPEVKVKNKTVFVTIEDTLKENTTYTFNFGSAIQDITEFNYTEGFRYLFSTGPFLDSISLHGNVSYAFDHKTEQGILVMLYDDLSDSVPYKKGPSYFAKTKKDGSFSINNIRAGTYKIFALKDANQNYLYDSDEEYIGFKNEPLFLQQNDSINLSLFKEVPKKLFLKKSTVAGYGHLLFVFNRPVEKINLQSLYTNYKKQWYIEEYSSQKDSLHVWLSDAGEPDSISIVLSENDKIIDTLFFNLFKKEDAFNPKKGKGEKISLRASSNIKTPSAFELNKKIMLEFNHPIKTFKAIEFLNADTSKTPECNLRITDELPLQRTYELSCIKVMVNEGSKQIPKMNEIVFKEKESYRYYLPPGMITDIFGLSNDTIKLEFTTREQKYYGTLKLTLNPDIGGNKNILQLVTEKDAVVAEKTTGSETTFTYLYLAPRNYKFKLILDENSNGKWDTGNYLNGTQPEKIIYCKEDISIRSNWDQEVEWKTK